MSYPSEHFMTEVLEKVASGLQNEAAEHVDEAPEWEQVPMDQRRQLKETLLPVVLATLTAAKEVRGPVYVGTCWPLQNVEVAEHLVSRPEDGDGRSEWTWLRTADGDLMLGLFPQGATYEELETPASDDFDAALSADKACYHQIDLDD